MRWPALVLQAAGSSKKVLPGHWRCPCQPSDFWTVRFLRGRPLLTSEGAIRKSRFTGEQMANILREAYRRQPSVGGQQHGISWQTLHDRPKTFGQLDSTVTPLDAWSIAGPGLHPVAGFRGVEASAEVPLPCTAGLFGPGVAALFLSRARSRRRARSRSAQATLACPRGDPVVHVFA